MALAQDIDGSGTFSVSGQGVHTARDLEPGMRISHNIQLVRLLGVGGMGSVWLADHAGLETQVAVKFMTDDAAAEPALVSRFAREAKLAARIKSPHVVQIFDYATTAGGVPFIVMELLDGEDLETRVEREHALDLEDTSRVLIQVCKALARAHALGVVHRDIKPENIFLIDDDDDIFVKVLDFGLARDNLRRKRITVSGTTMGTPSYMSPEQLFHPRCVDARSDLWSTAVVVYACLTGRLPFDGDSFGSICIAINSGRFVPPSQLNENLPPGLDAWFDKALTRKQDARFQSATEMANAFLAELQKAGLLPKWAAPRHAKGDVPSYTTDPGGISGGPITLRRPRYRRKTGLTLAFAAATLTFIGLSNYRQPILERARPWLSLGWAPLGQVPGLDDPRDASPLSEPQVRWVPPKTSAALAERDIPRGLFGTKKGRLSAWPDSSQETQTDRPPRADDPPDVSPPEPANTSTLPGTLTHGI
jgi:serine/threonine protein kinase